MKVSVIGAGLIGSHVAELVALNQIADKIVLVDSNKDRVEGEAMDLNQMLSVMNSNIDVVGTTDPTEINQSDIVVVAVGMRRKPGMIRTDLFPINMEKVRWVARTIRYLAPSSIVIVVTNPSDEMTEVVFRNTMFPKNRVIGLGNSLDSARFKEVIHRKTGLPRTLIDAGVVGEHGENMKHYSRWTTPELEEESRTTAIRTIEKKGATVFAPAMATYQIIESIIKDEKKWFVVAVHDEDQNRCIGTLYRIGREGIICSP